ncbi:hypothetical protein EDC01DRAFT_647621 [Geopyxis carbonaria]|nr:hypothetical protein EDC01DRAFT_647621 [Geopyxis carbonaria]
MQLQSLLSLALLATGAAAGSQLKLEHRAPQPLAARSAAADASPALTLLPYHPPTLHKRAPSPSDLELSDELMLHWASASETGAQYLAQLNVTATPETTKLIQMSRFATLTSAVDCSTADGDGLSLTFVSQLALDAAQKAWGWVKETDGNAFWLVTDPNMCAGVDGETQFVPYKVSDVAYHGLTAELTATRAEITEVLKGVRGEFAWGVKDPAAATKTAPSESMITAAPTAAAGDLYRRVWPFDEIKSVVESHVIDPIKTAVIDPVKSAFDEGWDKTKDAFGDAADGIKGLIDEAGDLSKDGSWEFDIATGTPGERSQLAKDVLGDDTQIYCIDCYSTGKFVIKGKIAMEDLQVKEASYSVAPTDIKLNLGLNAVLKKRDWSSIKFSLWSIPFAAIDIPLLFHFGPEFRADLEWGTGVNEDVDFNFGWSASLPNDAIVSNNFVDQSKADFSGWDAAEAHTLDFELNDGMLDVDVGASLTAVLSFGYDIFSLGGYEAALKAPLPAWTGNFTTGQCDAGNGTVDGITITESISAGINFYVGPNLMINDSEGDPPLVDVELYKWEKKFDPQCVPFLDNTDSTASNSTGNGTDVSDAELTQLDDDIANLEDELFWNEQSLDIMNDITGDVYIGDPIDGDAAGGIDLPIGDNSTLPISSVSAAVPSASAALPTPSAANLTAPVASTMPIRRGLLMRGKMN